MYLDVEFKARVADLAPVRERLQALGPRFAGLDHQRDTYFHVPHGRLKLREGTVETALIHYARADVAGVKRSDVTLYRPVSAAEAVVLGRVLTTALGVRVVVEKRREIYFVGHVKVHLDDVPGLGLFVEVEAISEGGARSEAALRADADAMRTALGLDGAPLEARSYADLVGAG